MNTATTIAETTEAARRMVRALEAAVGREFQDAKERRVLCNVQVTRNNMLAAALAQAFVDAQLSPEQVEAIEQTVGRYFE